MAVAIRWVAILATVASCGGKGRSTPAQPDATAGSAAGGSASQGGQGGQETDGSAAGATTAGRDGVAGDGAGGSDVAGAAGEGAGGEAGAPMEGPVRPLRAIQVTTGTLHSCALLEDHRVKCWGENSYGQLGVGDVMRRGLDPQLMGDQLRAVDLGKGRTATAIAAGRYATCALLDDETVKCWGLPFFHVTSASELVGDEPDEMGDDLPIVALPAGRKPVAVSIGYNGSAIALDDGSFLCGGTSFEDAIVPGPGPKLSSLHGAIAAVGLFEDGSARLIHAGLMGKPQPIDASASSGVSVLSAAWNIYCFYSTKKELSCMGPVSNSLPKTLPVVTSLGSTDNGPVCAVIEGGKLECWSRYEERPKWALVGTTPTGMGIPQSAPAIALASNGYEHQCALLSNGAVLCWSYGDSAVAAVGWNIEKTGTLQRVDLGTTRAP